MKEFSFLGPEYIVQQAVGLALYTTELNQVQFLGSHMLSKSAQNEKFSLLSEESRQF